MARRLSRLLPAGRKKFYLQCRVVPCSLFFFSGAEKRTKRDIHPNQTFPYMGRLNRSSCRSYIKVRSDHQRSGVIFYRLRATSSVTFRGLPFDRLRDRGESGSGPLGGSGDVLGATDRRSLRCPPLYWPPIRGAKV